NLNLPSFPTRRSSDLEEHEVARVQGPGGIGRDLDVADGVGELHREGLLLRRRRVIVERLLLVGEVVRLLVGRLCDEKADDFADKDRKSTRLNSSHVEI